MSALFFEITRPTLLFPLGVQTGVARRLDIAGQVEGAILYYDSTAWVPLEPGTADQVLTIDGDGLPSWADAQGGGGGTSNHASLTNRGLTAAGHTATGPGVWAFAVNGSSLLVSGTEGYVLVYGADGLPGARALAASDVSGVATAAALSSEVTTRGNADTALQGAIDVVFGALSTHTGLTSTAHGLTVFGLTVAGAVDSAAARLALGLVVGSDVQAADADLTAVAGLSGTGLARRTGAGTWSVGTTVSVGEGGTGATDASAARTALGLAIGSDVQAYDADLAAIAAISSNLGPLQRSGPGSWSVGTLPVNSGGTGSISASGARTNLGLAIGTNVQAYSANLTSYASVAPSAFALTLFDDADAPAWRATLGIVLGTDVQAYDADLAAVAALSSTGIARRTGSGTWSVGTTVSVAEGGTGATSESAARTALGVAIGSDVQAYSSVLATYASLTPSALAQTVLVSNTASVWRSNLGLVIGTDVQGHDADLAALAGVASTGILVRTGSGTAAARVVAVTGGLTVVNPAGTAGDITIGNRQYIQVAQDLTWTNQPAATTELLGVIGYRLTGLDFRTCTQVRLNVWVVVVGFAGAKLWVEYSSDGGTNWFAIGTSAVEVTIDATFERISSWIPLAAGAKADGLQVRIMGSGGNATADPSFRRITVQSE